MERGDRVLLRALGGQALVRWIWAVAERVVYVTDAAGLARLDAGEPTDRVIGFPVEDVFAYRSGIADGADVDWTAEQPAIRSVGKYDGKPREAAETP